MFHVRSSGVKLYQTGTSEMRPYGIGGGDASSDSFSLRPNMIAPSSITTPFPRAQGHSQLLGHMNRTPEVQAPPAHSRAPNPSNHRGSAGRVPFKRPDSAHSDSDTARKSDRRVWDMQVIKYLLYLDFYFCVAVFQLCPVTVPAMSSHTN